MATTGFVFIEITQPEIRSLLWRMQYIVSGAEPRHPVHVTLRGPYAGRIDPEIVEKSRRVLRNDTLKIGGVGRFREPEEVVFLRVDSPNLRKVCWKRDYPKKDGHEPHISLYRGPDATFADEFADFLAREALELFCTEYRLWIHRRAILDLESSDDRAAKIGESRISSESRQDEPRFLTRLRQFVDDYRYSLSPLTTVPARARGTKRARASNTNPP